MDGGVPRWEFFIVDLHDHPEPDADGRRPPIAQVGPPTQGWLGTHVAVVAMVVLQGCCSIFIGESDSRMWQMESLTLTQVVKMVITGLYPGRYRFVDKAADLV